MTGDPRGTVASAGPVRPARHYGNPADEYRAATSGCGVVVRGDRRMLRVHGRAPSQMLNGILTCRIPAPPGSAGASPLASAPSAATRAASGAADRIDAAGVRTRHAAALAGDSVYGAILTAKGRMLTDVEVGWLGADEAAGLGLSVSAAGREAALRHFGRFLPPRLARVEDIDDRLVLLTVLGPGADGAVRRAWPEGAGAASARAAGAVAASGDASRAGFALLDGGPLDGGVLLSRGLRQAPSWNVWVPSARAEGVLDRLRAASARPVGSGTWQTLRVEAGFPEFGVDMDDRTIPIEAGLGECAFDHAKGCYTGQEVIVRILHRGRVNWHLRRLRFDNAPARPEMQLFEPGVGKPRGRVTSVADSPRFGEVVGLGYVRREVEPPATLRLGSADGAEVRVVSGGQVGEA